MTRSRGALSITSINATYPYQVILVLTEWHRANLILLLNDRERLGGYRLWTGKQHGVHEFNVAHFPRKDRKNSSGCTEDCPTIRPIRSRSRGKRTLKDAQTQYSS
jgi:hypothetical protein